MDEPPAPPPGDQPLPEPPKPGLSAGREWDPPPRFPMRPAGNTQAGWLTLAGGVLVVLGVFLPWITASGPGGSVSFSGLDSNEWGFVILGGFALVRGLSMARPDRFHFTLGTPLIGGIILAVLVALRWGDLQDALAIYRTQPGVTASLGIGVWSVIAGTACVLLGGVMLLRRPS